MAGSASDDRYTVRRPFLDRRTGLTLPAGAPFVDHTRYAQMLRDAGIIDPATVPPARPQLDIFPPDRWVDDTVAIIAGGASLKSEKHLPLLDGVSTIVVNDAYRLKPDADILYAADYAWWEHHGYVPEFGGQRWTQHRGTTEWAARARERGLFVVESRMDCTSLSMDPAVIHTGANSAFQALNLAVLGGARRVLLLGVDLKGPHWFGDHPTGLNRTSPYPVFRASFEAVAPQLAEIGVEVVNCSRSSALQCFPKMTLRAALK